MSPASRRVLASRLLGPRGIAIACFVVALTACCVRLGVWQLGRYHERRALNTAMREMLARPPADLAADAGLADSLRRRRVRVRGRFDEHRHVLLAGQFHDGTPGVHVLTPFVPDGGTRDVLIDRGWVGADDAVTADPRRYSAADVREVTGLAATIPAGDPALPVRTLVLALGAGTDTVLSVASLGATALRRRLGPRLADLMITELPGDARAGLPVREPPRPYPEIMHLGYAVQWFAFAVILLAGSLALAIRGARGPAPQATRGS